MKILLVEDNKSIIKGLEYAFAQNGYSCEYCLSLDEAVRKAPFNYDVAVLDIMLPDGNGFDLFKKIRRYSDLPVIFLTAVDDEDSVVNGLELGADDYITKPFSTRELIARIKRVANKNSKKNIITVSGVTLDLDKSAVFENGKQLELTALEYKLLSLLMQNVGRVVTRELIFEKIWDVSGNFVNDNTLTVYIKRIRKKLDADIIKTVKGMGYQVAEVSK
ncbi:response regulator transcription factor [uncultured Ruminococcus sp.]|jgi:two component transcriptional regulator, winged helix family|uniref:response regulator transcription factor n=1 Tax=uncultured Ruminococcus sp. TaxID=165186 RepID=UPI000ED8F4CB|nr:response regulator transcription factor [uncultured Ruminococcus sp.]HAM07004.1 DNA-binding response regulator [Oscillospiraceae bacterium]